MPRRTLQSAKRSRGPLSVFLSYAHADKPIAHSLADALKDARVRVWIDEGELRAGDSIVERITEAISELEFVVALVSKDSVKSRWCSKELSIAVHEGLRRGCVRVVPLRIDDVEMPPALSDVLYLDIDSQNPSQIVPRLIKDIRSHRREINSRDDGPHFNPLSARSRFTPRRLQRLRLALKSRQHYVPDDAKEQLVADRSRPAADVLYEVAVDDRRGGFAVHGLMTLGPAAAPWIFNLLTHENDDVVIDGLRSLTEADNMMDADMFQHMVDTIEELVRVTDWHACETRMKEAMSTLAKSSPETHSLLSDRYEELLTTVKEIAK